MEDKSELDQSATSTVCVCLRRHSRFKKWADRMDTILTKLYKNQLGITSAYAVIASHGEGEIIYRPILPSIYN